MYFKKLIVSNYCDIMVTMNFNENTIISFKPKPLEEDPVKMESLLQRVEFINSKRPELTDFSDLYSAEKINEDEKKIENYEEMWDKEKDDHERFIKNFSDIYEAAVLDILDKNKTLGEGSVFSTTKHDNYFNAIDGVFVTDKENGDSEYLGLNMDVTFSSEYETLVEKFESIKQCIRLGILPCVEYFQDPKTKEHKKIFLPKIIIGSDRTSADGLVHLWGQTNRDNSEMLKNHPIQSQIIMETLTQLIYFHNFALNLFRGVKDPIIKEKYREIYNKYRQVYDHFHAVYLSKKDLVKSHSTGIEGDAVYKKIIELAKWKK